MPLNLDDSLPTSFPEPKYLTLDNFKNGVITLINKSRLPKRAMEEADNIFLYEDGMPGPRPGVNWYGTAMPNSGEIDGIEYFDFNDSMHLVAVAGGVVYRSTDDGTTWDECTGGTTTSGVTANMNQNGSFLYITTGQDNILRYDGTTTLQAYTTLTTPAAPTVVETGTGLTSGTSYQYYYKCARVNQVGFSAASAASTVIQTGLARESWSSGTNYATLTVPAYEGTQTRTDIYVSEDNVDYYYLGSTTTVTYVDDGTAIPVPGTSAPSDNTTQGPAVEELTNVGSRQYGVRDTDNRYRIWFTGSASFAGAFSSAYDGGYLDWQEGGKYIPVKVEDYRDGKGTPYATVWCKSKDGQGCVLQMTLDLLTVGDISVTVPSAYKLPGSRGTPAPGSVVNVLNDYFFYNSQAFYNLGSRAQFLNLLSTDEASANIRPTVKQISTSGESGIASAYNDAKVYFSVPYGSSTNNYTAVYDTEQKAWLPKAFSLGFKKFLKYVDTDGNRRLLAIKPGDDRLSEIGTNILGDYGVAFNTSLKTGLYPTTQNRFDFQFTEEGEIEFSNPQGTIFVELIGIERSRGFSSTNSETVTARTTSTGWDSFAWDTRLWDDTSDAIDTYSEASVKRYFTVQKELNAVQWRITTNTLDAKYILRTLQTWGTETQAGKPREWRL